MPPVRCLLLALALIFAARSASAQVIRGHVVEEGTERAVSQAFVVLADQSGVRVGAAMTDTLGDFILRAPGAGRYVLRVERIGFRSTTSIVFDLAAQETRLEKIAVSVEAIELEGIRATGQGRCNTPRELGAATSLLWGEARKVLEIAEWVRSDRGVPYQAWTWERGRSLVSAAIGEQSSRFASGVGRAPFYSEAAGEMAEHGYVRALPGGVYQYFGLDGPTLLSDSFVETHCFRIEDPGRGEEGLIGLAFEPVPTHHRPDVEGVLWLDRESAELRYLEFEHTQHLFSIAIPPEPFGGRAEFEKLGNGAWIVARWWIRMPQMPATWRGAAVTMPRPTDASVDELGAAQQSGLRMWEKGGAVSFIGEPGGVARGPASVMGMVYDSTRGTPLRGATVFLRRARRTTLTDREGRFWISGVPEGPDEIGFLHPYADSLGHPVRPRPIELQRGTRAEAELAIPRGEGCPSIRSEKPWMGVTGLIIDGRTGEPVVGAEVTVEWTGRNSSGRGLQGSRRRRHALTGEAGEFLVCVPERGVVKLRAMSGQRSGAVELRVEAEGLLRHDLPIR